jgi:hypothetical protein
LLILIFFLQGFRKGTKCKNVSSTNKNIINAYHYYNIHWDIFIIIGVFRFKNLSFWHCYKSYKNILAEEGFINLYRCVTNWFLINGWIWICSREKRSRSGLDTALPLCCGFTNTYSSKNGGYNFWKYSCICEV